MPSILSPLQLTVAASMFNNTGLKSFPATLQTAINSFNTTTVINNFIAAVNFYKAQTFATQSTLDSLLTIGSTVCPALGNSIPASPVGSYPYLNSEYLVTYFDDADGSSLDPSGFSNLIEQTCAAYLGNGDYGRFSTGFMAVQGYIRSTNELINSSVNANQYLGPTFTNMDDLTTANIASINTDLANFGLDLAKQGQLWDPKNIDLYGTPAGLVQQISRLAGTVRGQTVPILQAAMISVGLTDRDIFNIVTNNQVGYNNPDGISSNDFDRLQKKIYSAFTTITGENLQQILDLLDVTTPNIVSLEELLDPRKVYPLSYTTMQTPSPNGPVAIFGSQGSVNSSIAPIVNSYLPTASGCDELGKIIPPADAVANKAIEVALKQVNNVTNLSLPGLAQAIQGWVNNPWEIAKAYLTNDIVSVGSPVPTYYRAQQDVPVGISITNTAYWLPTTLGGISTMSGLPLIQAQTAAVDPSVTSYIASIATGSGPNGTITTYDVLGLTLDADNFAAQLNTATTAINALQGAGSLNTLNTAYTNILAAVNDAGVITQINNANAAIAALSASPYVTTLNTAWTYMANLMNLSAKYTTQAGINYFEILPGDKNPILGFVLNLPAYALLTANEDAAEYLENLADSTVLGGQAIIGAMREGRNAARLAQAGMYNTTQIPSEAPVIPVPVITPVNS